MKKMVVIQYTDRKQMRLTLTNIYKDQQIYMVVIW